MQALLQMFVPTMIDRACPDQFVGTVIYNTIPGGNAKFSAPTSISSNRSNNEFGLDTKPSRKRKLPCQTRTDIDYATIVHDKKLIVLVVESPHNDEFKENNGISDMPIFGASGVTFDKHFIDVLNAHITRPILQKLIAGLAHNKELSVAVVNAIQYQCSLGITRDFSPKNSIFSGFWNKKVRSGKDDLRTRLELLAPDLIIGAVAASTGSGKIIHDLVIPTISSIKTARHEVAFLNSGNHISKWKNGQQLV
jgi:hypothetical protein